MRNYLFKLLLFPSAALAQAPAPATYSYAIRGKLGQLDAPAKVYLVDGVQPIDSAALRQGRFELRGHTAFPHSATLVLERRGRLQSGFQAMKLPGGKVGRAYVESPDRRRLFLEPGPVVVTGPDSLRTARVAGGALTADYQRLTELTKLVERKQQQKSAPAQAVLIDRENAQAKLAFVRDHPGSWVGLEAMQQARLWEPPRYAEVAPLYAALTPAQRASPPGQQYGELVAGLKRTALGAQAPAFTQPTPGGKPVALADYRGRYVLVDFWASWCKPCRAENPVLLQAYETFRGRNFEVLGVSLDEEAFRGKWVEAIAADHVPWTQVSDLQGFRGPTALLYGIQDIPQNFLVDPSGKIVASNLHGDELLTTLAALLK